MNFNTHSDLIGLHAFLGASKYHWVNYDEEKISSAFSKHLATERGTRLHAVADELINLGIRLPKTKQTLNMYVNDAIGFKMKTEQPLYYSENCFGTADAISFKKNFLRIHDYKSGVTKASMMQLQIYAALFCLEYKYDPAEIEIELRIYQNDDLEIYIPLVQDIQTIMGKIILFDLLIEKIKLEG
jgi:hypothetical protein